MLSSLLDFFSLSAGYNVDLESEIEYYEQECPKGWLVATNFSGKNIGFVRSFNQGNDWSLAELFVLKDAFNRTEVAAALIQQFISGQQFEKGHRIRFDINTNDVELNSAFQSIHNKYTSQIFKYYEKNICHEQLLKIENQNSLPSLSELVEVFKNLHPVNSDDVDSWLKRNLIRFVEIENKIVSAAHLNFYSNSIEIVRIATHPFFLRRGFSEKLICNIELELSSSNFNKLFLKVESVRLPAVQLYEKLGFSEVVDKSEIWYSFLV